MKYKLKLKKAYKLKLKKAQKLKLRKAQKLKMKKAPKLTKMLTKAFKQKINNKKILIIKIMKKIAICSSFFKIKIN